MGDPQVKSVDDLISCMVGMGFDIADCRQAVSQGKLTVDAAVEWILAGKPASTTATAPTAPRLHLGPQRPVEVSNLDAFPPVDHTSQRPLVEACCGVNADADAADVPPPPLVSRLHASDKQQQIRERFEEKQRDGARRDAIEEKRAKKEAHSRALKQIQEDREMKQLKLPHAAAPLPSGSNTDNIKPTEKQDKKATSDTCMLQIRLPNGRALKRRFAAAATLSQVWSYVESEYSECLEMCLMQPFPRQEFGAEDMPSTLRDLHLVPTGSLVLKKVDLLPPATQVVGMETGAESGEAESVGAGPVGAESGVGPAAPPPRSALPPAPASHPPPLHMWGGGHRLEADAQAGSDGGAGVVSGEAAMGEAAMDVVPHPPGWGQFGVPQHMWGEGARLIDEDLDMEHLPHRQRVPTSLAAAAASVRDEHRGPADRLQAPPPAVPSLVAVESLLHMLLRHVAGRVCDARQPISGLHGLPAALAEKLLRHLVAERLLRARTLHAFVSCRLQHLNLDCYIYATNELLAAIRHHTKLVSLSLSSCPLITDSGLNAITSLQRLRSLSLAGCRQLTDRCLPQLTELRSLQSLVLADTGVTDAGVTYYARLAPPALHMLSLSRTAVTQRIFEALAEVRTLRILNLEQTALTSLSGLEALTLLEALDVRATHIDAPSVAHLRPLTHLTSLSLPDAPGLSGDDALAALAGLRLHSLSLPSRLTTTHLGLSFIAHMPLQTLDLTNYINVGDSAMEHLALITSLQRLRLSNTRITDVGLALLHGLINLEELLLNRTEISDIGAAVVRNFTKLEELSLCETRVTDDLLTTGVLNNCVVLLKLNLSRTTITDKGILCLHLPHLSLLNVDETMVRAATVSNLPQCPQLQKVIWRHLNPPNSNDL